MGTLTPSHDVLNNPATGAGRPAHANGRGRLTMLTSPLGACWLGREEVDRTFADARLGSRPTDGLFLYLALLGCALLGAPMSFVEIGFAGFAGATIPAIVLLPRVYLLSLKQPTTILALLWALWQLLSLAWTPDRELWLYQFGVARFALGLIILYPLLERRRLLIATIACAYLLQNISQVITAVAIHEGWTTPWRMFPDRNAGWSVPVAGATVLVGALGLHLPAAFMGRGRGRWLGLCGSAITLTGIFATGTRGAWLGAALLVAIVAVLAVLRRQGLRQRLSAAALALGILAATSAGAWMVAGDAISRRAGAAWTEARSALVDGNLNSDNGARIMMARFACEAFAEHPIRGIGAGGFRAWTQSHLRAAGDEPADRFHQHGHCHNTPLQLLATTGLVGFGLFTALIIAALYGAFSRLTPQDWGTYAAGPGFAIVGLLTVIPFDVIHVNAQTAALLYVMIALCAVKRPTEVDGSVWAARRQVAVQSSPPSSSSQSQT